MMRWMNALAWVTAILLCSSALGREEKPVILHLASGAEVSGVIVEDGFNEITGLRLRRDDNGGLLQLRWEQIHPDDEKAIKRSYGYVSDEPAPIQVRALKVKFNDSEMIGFDGGMQNGRRVIIRRGVVVPIPDGALIENVMVDALEVENPPEAFARMMNEKPPREAIDWFNMGLVAESLTLYDRAKSCFDDALKLDPQFTKKDVIEQRKKLIDLKAKETDAADYLRRIRTLKLQRDFDKALELALAFQAKWPTSALLKDVQSEISKLGVLQKNDLINQLQSEFFAIARDLILRRTLDKEFKLGPAMTWAEDSLFGECLEVLSKRKSKPVPDLFKLWQERNKYASLTAATYGAGTFILGTDASKQIGQAEKEGDADADGAKANPKKPQTLEEKIKQKLQEKAEAAKKRDEKKKTTDEIADVPPTPDEWWDAASTNDRSSFLMAWFGEHARYEGAKNVLTLARVTFRACGTCAGQGVIIYFAPTNVSGGGSASSEVITPCPRCKKLTFDRIVHFK